MPVDFDTRRRLVSEDDFVRLVRAVRESGDRDGERHWIEWKSELSTSDDSRRDESGKYELSLAQEIIAMANRAPGQALSDCEGYAYVVVGASHKDLKGVERLKTSDWEMRLAQHLGIGDGAPRWTPVTVRVDEVPVLVIEVDAPRDGDPIFCLRTKAQRAEAGTVFARGIERSAQATPDQLRMLQHRLLAGSLADTVAERLALVCSTLRFDVTFNAMFAAWRVFAVVQDDGRELVVHVSLTEDITASLPAGLQLLPLRGEAMLVVIPAWLDIERAAQGLQKRFASESGSNPLAGKQVGVCHSNFGQLHSAVQAMTITAGTDNASPYSPVRTFVA